MNDGEVGPVAWEYECNCGGVRFTSDRKPCTCRAPSQKDVPLVRVSDLPEKWQCNACDAEFYVDTSEGEGTTCPRCAAIQTEQISLNSGEQSE